MTDDKGIIDNRNPFWCKSWEDEPWELTQDRWPELEALFYRTVDSIKNDRNKGTYVACKGILGDLAKMSNGVLFPTKKWKNRYPIG